MSDVYSRFVEPGRLVRVTYGREAGKLCVIVGLINERRVLVDGPTTGVPRQPMPVRRLRLTEVVVEGVEHNCSKADLQKAVEKSDVVAAYTATREGHKAQCDDFVRNLDDFGRWRLRMALKKRVQAAQKL